MSTPQIICEPTCTGIGIRNATDAFTLLEAVRTGLFPLRRHRLSQAERDNLSPGQVFVWTESSESSGLERWTDGRKWSASRTRDVFLIYEEREEPSIDESVEKAAQRITTYFSSNTPTGSGDLFGIFAFPKDRPPKLDGLMKQTFSAWVNDLSTGQRVKWHLSAYLSRQGPASLPSVTEHPLLSRIRVPNGVYECCTGPRKNRRGSRPQPPASSAVQVGAVTHIQTTPAASTGYRRGSSAASGRTAVESEAPPGQHQQYSSYHHDQQMPPSTGPIRVATKSEMNNYDAWDQHHSHYVGDHHHYAITVNTLRSPSLSFSSVVSTPVSVTSTLSPPTSGATTPRTMSSSSLGAVTIADRDYDRERERRLQGFLGPRSAGGVDDGGNCYYMPSSPMTDSGSGSGSGSSPSVTPSPTILSTTTHAYPYHCHPTTRDATHTSISVPPLFNKGSDTRPSKHHVRYRSPSPITSPSMYQPTQTQDTYPFKQRLPSSNSVAFNAGGGGMASHYNLRTDTDSKAVAAFRPF